MENNKKYSDILKIRENSDNLILKYIDENWYLLFGGNITNVEKSLRFLFHFRPFQLNILASTKKIDGCYLLDREVKSINIGNRILSLDDIDPLKNHLRETMFLVDDAIFTKKQNNVFKVEEPIQEEFYRKGFNDALEMSKKENLKLKNNDIFEWNCDISENTFFVEINVSNLEDFDFKKLTEIAGKEQFIDNNAIKKHIIDLFINSNDLIQPTIYIKKHSKTIEHLNKLSEKETTTAVKKPRGKK
jgi:hypothetical protein